MAESELKELLEEFDRAFPDPITTQNLYKNRSNQLINRAQSSGLIYNPSTDKWYTTERGLGMIIQIRTKHAIDKLHTAIEEFNESSKRFSKGLFWLTLAYTLFSLLLVLKEFFPTLFP